VTDSRLMEDNCPSSGKPILKPFTNCTLLRLLSMVPEPHI